MYLACLKNATNPIKEDIEVSKQRLANLQAELFNSREIFNYNQFNEEQLNMIRAYFGSHLIKNNYTIDQLHDLIIGFLSSDIYNVFSAEDLRIIAKYYGRDSVYPTVDIEELNKAFSDSSSSDNTLARKRVRE